MATPPRVHELPDSAWQRCEAALTQFALAWQPDWPPPFEHYLTEAGVGRWGLLVEFCLTDLELRVKAGLPVTVAAYFQLYPELGQDERVRQELEATASRHRPRPDEAAPPTVIDNRYELREEIGRGSFAVVYRAWDRQLNRAVALKRARWSWAENAAAKARFLREAQLTAQLQHPHIIKLFDVIPHDQQVCLVLELMPGETLETRLLSSQMTLREGVKLLAQVANALHEAHQQGILHRDLKPSNILLNSIGEPIVTDFGLAYHADAATLTATGELLGTPAYMAPEQLTGQRRTDARADIYALGVILYRLLTGDLPFRGSARAVLHQLLQPVQPPTPRQLRSEVPRDLEWITLKAMARFPSDRYATMAELAADLNAWLAGQPVQARPLSPAVQLARFLRRNPFTSSLTIGLLLSLFVGFVLVFWQWRRAEDYLLQARQEQRVAEASADLAHNAAADLLRVSRVHPVFWDGKIDPLRLAILTNALGHFEQMVQARPRDAVLRYQLVILYELHYGHLLRELNRPAVVLPNIERSARHCRQLVADQPGVALFQAKFVRVLLELASTQELAGQMEASEQTWHELANQAEAILASWPTTEAEFRDQLQRVTGSGQEWFQDHLAPTAMLTAGRFNLLEDAATARFKLGDAATAEAHCRAGLRLIEQHPDLGTDLFRRFKQSVLMILQSRCRIQQRLPADVPALLAHYHRLREGPFNAAFVEQLLVQSGRLAECLEQLGHYAEAAQLLESMASDWEALVPGSEKPKSTRQSAGAIWHEAGNLWSEINPREAMRVYEQAVLVRRGLQAEFPEKPQCRLDLSATLFSLARLQARHGLPEFAEPNLREALEHYDEVLRHEPEHLKLKLWRDDRVALLRQLVRQRGEWLEIIR